MLLPNFHKDELQQRNYNRGTTTEELQQRNYNRGTTTDELQQTNYNRGTTTDELQQRNYNRRTTTDDLPTSRSNLVNFFSVFFFLKTFCVKTLLDLFIFSNY
jgi:hypothetical protein